MILAQQDCFTTPDAKVGNRTSFSQSNIYRILPFLHLGHNQYARYHDPSSSGSPDIYWQGSFGLQGLSRKRGIIQQTFIEICQKLIWQVIYTLDTICVPNIMIPAQVVLQIFCWHDYTGLQCASLKREIIQPNINGILPKVNQVSHTLDPICLPNIVILAQAVFQVFCWQGSIDLQCRGRKTVEKKGS